MFVIQNAAGKFLAMPESGKRHGARASLKPWPTEWTDLDHAVRFETEEVAKRVAASYYGSILPLTDAWRQS